MKFVMVGSGAVGGYFGAKLQQTGHEVVFVARGHTLRVLRERGIILRREHDETIIHPVVATDDMDSIRSADYVMIGVKTWQVEEVARQLPAFKDAHTRFLTLQNGVEAGEIVARYAGVERTDSGLVRGFFQLEAPGEIRHVGVQPTIIFGQLDGKRTPQSEILIQHLLAIGAHAELSGDIDAALWEKFLLVTSLSGVGAVTRAPIGAIREYDPTYQMLQGVMHEIVQVAHAHKINLPDEVIARVLKFIDTFPYEATTSMQRDIMEGLPSELEAQTGAVVRLGRKASVPTPLNEFIYNSLLLQEQYARTRTRPGSD